MSQTRRLAAILAADVAGYSRLMGVDEEGTHERLQAHLQELVNPKIAEHRGRVVKNTGDGFLAEYPSVVDAVRCAVEIQRGMADRNASPPSPPLRRAQLPGLQDRKRFAVLPHGLRVVELVLEARRLAKGRAVDDDGDAEPDRI